MMHKSLIRPILLIWVLLVGLPLLSQPLPKSVRDDGDILKPTENRQIEQLLNSIYDDKGFDFRLVTIDSLAGRSVRETSLDKADEIGLKAGMGQSTCIGIGGDPIIGTTTKEAVMMLTEDQETEGIVMIGEIGGNMEADAANWIKENGTKPVVGFIAGQTAPPGRRMGHAGAIIGGADDTAEAKMKIMRECGIRVAESPADIGITMVAALSNEQ